MTGWEAAAVILGIAYLLLAVREQISCWYAAFFSSGIYLFVFWDANLLMESALQLYYMAMAVYGWWQWQHGGSDDSELPIHRWEPKHHITSLAIIIAFSVASGILLTTYTEAANPFLDSFTTWGAVLTTWMVARKVLENWLYWLVIDSVSIYLYLDRELYLTAGLFAVYIVIAVFGFLAWLKHFRNQSA